jgi:lysophospholipase L1-like esterase
MKARSPIHGSRIALLGTSLVQQNHLADGRNIWSSARGWSTWAEVLSGGQLDIAVFHDPRVHPGWEPSGRMGVTRGFGGLNAGVSGQKARDIADRLDEVLKLDFDLIIVDAGTNDMMVETKEVIQAVREAIAERLLDAGKLVILLPILARGTQKWVAGGSERAKAHWINQKTLAFAARRAGCHVFDWNEPWVDWNSADGVPRAGYSDDGTHFSVPGGYAVGKVLAAYLAGFLAPTQARRWAQDDRFDPVDNPLGNLVPDPLLTGAGTFADGVAVSQCGYLSGRIVSRPDDPARWQEISLSEGQHVIDILGPDYLNPLPAGAWLQATCAVEVDAHDGWRDISLALEDKAPEGLTARALAPFDLGGELAAYPGEAWAGLLKTPPIKLKTSLHGLRLGLSLELAPSTSSASIRMGAALLRQVAPPQSFTRRPQT